MQNDERTQQQCTGAVKSPSNVSQPPDTINVSHVGVKGELGGGGEGGGRGGEGAEVHIGYQPIWVKTPSSFHKYIVAGTATITHKNCRITPNFM